MSANEKQIAGEHYKEAGHCPHCKGELQHWDMVDMFGLDYFQGQITKYVMRWHRKNGVQDLMKAQHFIEKYIELQQSAPVLK